MFAAIPSLRAFAISVSGNVDRADDLVQETLLRAIANINSFHPGSHMSEKKRLLNVRCSLGNRTIRRDSGRAHVSLLVGS
jgi:hypothetical protein